MSKKRANALFCNGIFLLFKIVIELFIKKQMQDYEITLLYLRACLCSSSTFEAVDVLALQCIWTLFH
jgi:hypothetical protein